MKYNLIFYPDPGLVFDISKMLFVKLNTPNIWKEMLTSIDSPEEFHEFIIKHSKPLPDPKPELLLFSFLPTNKKYTFLSMIIDRHISKSFFSFTIKDFLSYFEDVEQVKNDLLSYYLGDQDYSQIMFEHMIRSSKTIPDRIKLLLFGFSYNPKSFINQLIKTIQSYHDLLLKCPLELPSNDDLSTFYQQLYNQFFSNRKTKKSISTDTPLGYSLCRCTPDFLFYNLANKELFFITTNITIDIKIKNQVSFSTHQLLLSLNALNDQIRLDIIRLLKTKSSLSTVDIAEQLSLPLSTTKYHLGFLKIANIITLKKTDGTSCYSYNPTGFQNIIKVLNDFEKGDFDK